jgi:hypothetical protein
MEAVNSAFREMLKPGSQNLSSVLVGMVVRAVRFLTILSVFTFFKLEKIWVVFLFFPTVRIGTCILVVATICITHDEIVCLPRRAHF